MERCRAAAAAFCGVTALVRVKLLESRAGAGMEGCAALPRRQPWQPAGEELTEVAGGTRFASCQRLAPAWSLGCFRTDLPGTDRPAGDPGQRRELLQGSHSSRNAPLHPSSGAVAKAEF